MALNDLLAALARDARLEAKQLLRESYAERERIIEASQERIGALQRERLEGKRRSLKAEMRGEVAAERRRSRAAIAAAEERLIARVLEVVSDHLDTPTTLARLQATTADRLAELLRYGEGRELRVESSPSLLAGVRQAVSEIKRVEVVADPSLATGWTVRSPDASFLIDDTLSARLDHLMPRVRMEIVNAVNEEASA